MSELGNEDEVWKQMFDILEWSGKHIIAFAGCQDLVKNLKGIKSTANETLEELKVLKGENNQLKREKRILEQEVSSLKSRLEDGRRVEGRLKRKLKVRGEVYKGRLLKLADSICDTDETGDEDSGGDEDEVASSRENSGRTDKHKRRKKEDNHHHHMGTVTARKRNRQSEPVRDNEIRGPSSRVRTPLTSKNKTVHKDAIIAIPADEDEVTMDATTEPLAMGGGS